MHIEPYKELSADIFGERYKCHFIPVEGRLSKVNQYLLKVSHLPYDKLV